MRATGAAIGFFVLAVAGGIYLIGRSPGTGSEVSQVEDKPSLHATPGPVPRSTPNAKAQEDRLNEVLRERNELARENAKLAQARQAEENLKNVAQLSSEFANLLASKLTNPKELAISTSPQDAARRAGQLHRSMMDFTAKWEGKLPPPGSGEAAEFQKKMSEMASEMAAWIKYSEENPESMSQRSELARYYSETLNGALDLNAGQLTQVRTILERHYEDGFSRKLDQASRPEHGRESWDLQRGAVSQRAHSEVQANLTPEQRKQFQRLYPPEFLWRFNVGPWQ